MSNLINQRCENDGFTQFYPLRNLLQQDLNCENFQMHYNNSIKLLHNGYTGYSKTMSHEAFNMLNQCLKGNKNVEIKYPEFDKEIKICENDRKNYMNSYNGNDNANELKNFEKLTKCLSEK